MTIEDDLLQGSASYDYKFSGSAGLYTMEWPSQSVHARISRLNTNRNHEVKGEVVFTSSRPTSAGHLRQGQFSLTSPTSRRSIAKSLEERDATVDWDTVMEQLCVEVLGEYRRGSPVVEIAGDDDVEARNQWLVEPLIEYRHPTVVYGPGASGKSWLAQYVAVLADAGVSTTGLSVEPSRCLYLDWETDENEISARVTLLRRGLGLQGKSHILYKRMEQAMVHDLEEIHSLVVEREVTLLVIDSIGSACMGEPENAQVVLDLFGALRTLRTTSLSIDHTNKGGELFGSAYKFNQARQLFEIKKNAQGPGENQMLIGLFHRKHNNSPMIRDMGFELTFGPGDVTIKRQDVRESGLEEHMRIVDRIENLLRRGAMTAFDIAETLEKTESHVRNQLSTHREKFVRIDDPANREPSRYANRLAEQEKIAVAGAMLKEEEERPQEWL